MFDDINIARTDSANNEVSFISVPVTYGPKDKMLQRVLQDPNIDRPTATPTLPMISFEMGAIKYDGVRKLPSTNRIVAPKGDGDKLKYQYEPVPYNIDFRAYIYAKNVEDGNKILEQILPFFTPDWTTSVNLISETDVQLDIPIVLNNVSYEDKYNGDFSERRMIIWTLDLVVKGYFYGPIRRDYVIKFANTSFYVSNSSANSSAVFSVTVQPGLTSNGQPTSNIAQTIPYNQIQADNDYGYIIIKTVYDDQ